MTSPRTNRLLAGAAALLATAAVAAPAQADSIAYVKDGNVYLSTSDGARQYQVTSEGGYSYVSQSDLGSIVALYGDHIRTLDRVTGAVRHDILTPASSSYPGTQFRGPFDPVVSPDGTRVAYTWYYTQTGSTDNCNPSTGCQTVYGRQGTGFTKLDELTGFDDYGYQSRSGWVGPAWLGSDAVISSDPIQVGNQQTAFMTPGSEYDKIAGSTSQWFSNNAVRELRDVERNQQKTGFAGIAKTNEDQELIQVYRPGEDYPKLPTDACFQIDGAEGRFQGPSWKPDGTRLAWSDDAGINTIAMPDLKADCGTPPETETKLLIPGGHSPDWGPAEVPPARAVTPVKTPTTNPTPAPTTGPGHGPDAAPSPAATSTLKVTGATKRAVLREGLLVRVANAKAGRYPIHLLLGKRTVGRATLKVAASGTGSVRVKVAKASRKRLRGKRAVTLTVTGAGLCTTVKLG